MVTGGKGCVGILGGGGKKKKFKTYVHDLGPLRRAHVKGLTGSYSTEREKWG